MSTNGAKIASSAKISSDPVVKSSDGLPRGMALSRLSFITELRGLCQIRMKAT